MELVVTGQDPQLNSKKGKRKKMRIGTRFIKSSSSVRGDRSTRIVEGKLHHHLSVWQILLCTIPALTICCSWKSPMQTTQEVWSGFEPTDIASVGGKSADFILLEAAGLGVPQTFGDPQELFIVLHLGSHDGRLMPSFWRNKPWIMGEFWRVWVADDEACRRSFGLRSDSNWIFLLFPTPLVSSSESRGEDLDRILCGSFLLELEELNTASSSWM